MTPGLPSRPLPTLRFITKIPLIRCALIWLLCLASWNGGPTVVAQTQPAEINLAQAVPVWVAELDGSSAHSRREAEQKLLDAGPAAAEYVPVSLDHLSLDARERMQRIRDQWGERQAEVAVEATIVKMQHATTLGEALQAISLASGVDFDLASAGPQPEQRAVRPPAAPMGFWQALDLVLDQTDLDINYYAGERNRLALVPRQPARVARVDAAAYAGIYRLEPTIVTARRVLGDPSQNALNLTIAISWQPNRTPIGLSIPIAELSGKLDNDVQLKPQSSGDQIDIATSAQIAESQFYLPMQLPPRQFEIAARGDAKAAKSDATEIELLTAQITALIPGERRKFELLLTAVAPQQTHDAMTVAIEAIRKSDSLHEIRVGVELFGAGRALESHRQWIFENEVHVQMPDGTRQDHLGYQVYRQTESGVGIGYLFDLGDSVPAGAKLIYESPTSVRRDQVPFVLNGIPLP